MKLFLKKFINSFLTPQFLWKYFITASVYKNVMNVNSKKNNLFKRFYRKIWFLPSIRNAQPWSVTTFGGKLGPDKFLNMDEHSILLMNEVIRRTDNTNEKILDLGCNMGRHLNFLYKKNFNNLIGVDISKNAYENFEKYFPDTKKNTSYHVKTFEEFLIHAGDNEYDIIYSHGATVEEVPATFPLIKNLTRVTKKYIILLISEKGHSAQRFWEVEFKRNGFYLIKLVRPFLYKGNIYNQTLMVFQSKENINEK